MNKWPLLLLLLWTTFLSPSVFAEEWPKIDLDGIDLSSAKRIQVADDPVYKKAKEYEAIPLSQVLSKLDISEFTSAKDSVVVFAAKDGYNVAMSLADAKSEKGYIAFRDTSAPAGQKWVEFKFGKEMTTPAPYYLIWSRQGIDKWRYPWPFQLASISIQPASAYFGAAAPVQANEGAGRGFNLFTTYCIRCHSINLSGGNVGPELNIPKNITEYFIENELSGFILNAPAYRSGTKMPSFDKIISPKQADSIVTYLKHMKTEKIGKK